MKSSSLALLSLLLPLASCAPLQVIQLEGFVPSQLDNFQARLIVSENETLFGTFIEGAAVDLAGSAFAVNFGSNDDRNTIGRLDFGNNIFDVEQNLEFRLVDPPPTLATFNGIRVVCDDGDVGGQKVFFAADNGNKRVIRVVKSGADVQADVFCTDPEMLLGVPNDLAVDYAANRLYLSGQAFNENTVAADGEIWLCDRNGQATKLSDENLVRGRTNGIELSLDGLNLFVSEALNINFTPVENRILKFDVDPVTGLISNRQVFFDFADDNTQNIDIDGMRLDVRGNLYVVRNGGLEVVILSPEGQIVQKIPLSNIRNPTNIELAGPEGLDAIVVGRCGDSNFGEGVGCVETFTVPFPGRAFAELVRQANEICPWV